MLRGFLASLLLLLPLTATAAEPVRLVTGTDYAPFADENLPEGGAVTALVRAAFTAAGRNTELTYTSWNRALEETRLGRFDVTAPYVHSPERVASFHYSSALLDVDSYALSSRDRNAMEKSIGPGMPGPRACLPLGWSAQPALRALLENGTAQRIETPHVASCLKMILADRVDFFVISKQVGLHLMKTEGLQPQAFRFSEKPIAYSTLHLVVPRERRGATALLEEFERGLALIRANGHATAILARHGLIE